MTVNMVQARNNLSEIVRKAEAGEDVVIERHGKPAVRLVSVHPPKFQFGFIKLTEAQRAAMAQVDFDEPAFPPTDPHAPLP